jgi:hypothetical protein
MVATAADVLGMGSSGRCCGWWESGTALTMRWLLLHAHLQSALPPPLSWVSIGGFLAGERRRVARRWVQGQGRWSEGLLRRGAGVQGGWEKEKEKEKRRGRLCRRKASRKSSADGHNHGVPRGHRRRSERDGEVMSGSHGGDEDKWACRQWETGRAPRT